MRAQRSAAASEISKLESLAEEYGFSTLGFIEEYGLGKRWCPGSA